MNTRIPSSRILSSALLPVALLAFAVGGCTKQDQSQAKSTAKEAYEDTKDAMANAWDKAKSFTFDQRNDFTANAKALAAKMETQTSKVHAEYSDAKASAARKTAMEELKNSEADYKEKVNALGSATSATWDSAKQNTIVAWNRLQEAYYRARAE